LSTYIKPSFYSWINSEAAVNWVLVMANRCSVLKVIKKTRESCESKLILLLAAIGYAVGFGNVWCFRTWHRHLVDFG